ncbi:hypothetical protein HPT27_03820 [Permianibacter sp. IMCC34836]|uniref:hypothetical protein n=1 Tax=Permianibacter fluminis TaxID=2738515 RepID=UPI001551F272|nr:hypothetical protein [Permianibacter fluminis]NQD36139.1 hypothetical protein [Permianibacter fluminis]
MSQTASLSALLSTLLFAVLPADAGASDSALLRCRAISDDAARLTCYDALTPAVLNLSETAKVPMAEAEAETRAATPAAVAPASTAKAAAPASPTIRAQTADEFGLERKAQAENLEAIESRIVGEFRGWDSKTKFALENGQVWAISDGSSATYRLMDPVVRVERGVFGSFMLKIEGVNRSPKVKRVK